MLHWFYFHFSYLHAASGMLDWFNTLIGIPSSFGVVENWSKIQKKLGKNALKCHRPGKHYGTHVSLYYKGFDTFSSEFRDVEIDKNDCTFALEFCWAMAEAYGNEDDRMEKATDLLNSYFQNDHDLVKMNNMDGAIQVSQRVVILVEAKNEIGKGRCDSYMQAVAFYHRNTQKLLTKIIESTCAPCLLVELVGPHFAVSGAVCGEHILVDRLTPFLWCVPQPNDRAAMIQLARCLKALKNALCQLIIDCKLPRKQPRFPFFNSDKYTYEKQIKSNVFYCHDNKDESKKVIIKFVETYGIDVHRFMAEKSYAPTVLEWCQVTTRYHAVVMDCIRYPCLTAYINTCPTTDDKQKCKDSLTAMVRAMHDEGYCHGDLRGNNIIVQLSHPLPKLFIIDFDWARKIGEQRYPYFMNHAEIDWPKGAKDNELITPDHDLYWIEHAFSGSLFNN